MSKYTCARCQGIAAFFIFRLGHRASGTFACRSHVGELCVNETQTVEKI